MEIRNPEEKFYGRIKSRRLTERQSSLFETLSDIFIKSAADIPTDSREKFLEIGFGNGDHTAQLALQNPDKLFVGCEPFVNGVASLLSKIYDNNLKNILIFQGDARTLLSQIQAEFFSGVFLLFPDPWPKRKHIRRRFLQNKTIQEIHRILDPNGFFRVASDHEEYKKWILKIFNQPKTAELFAFETFDKSTRPPEDIWPKTKYEKKAENDILYLVAKKI